MTEHIPEIQGFHWLIMGLGSMVIVGLLIVLAIGKKKGTLSP